MKAFLSALVANPMTYILLPFLFTFIFKNGKLKKVLYAFSVVLFLLFSNRPLLKYAGEQWYAPFDQPLPQDKTYEYGVVLGGYSNWDWKRDRIECNRTADRLTEGIRLYKIGKIKKLVLASDGSIFLSKDGKGIQGNPEGMLRYLRELGVPPEDVILEKYASTTRENVTLTKELLGGNMQSENTLLITSATHMRRSYSAFNQEGLEPDCYISDAWPDFKGEKEKYRSFVETFVLWEELLHEWIGYGVYKLRGW